MAEKALEEMLELVKCPVCWVVLYIDEGKTFQTIV